MQPDIDRLREVCKWIRNHPERHRQADWAYRVALDLGVDQAPPDDDDEYFGMAWFRKVYPASTVTLDMIDAGTACGTALCAAGTAALMAGAQLLFEPGERTTYEVLTPDGDVTKVSEYAAAWLGLNFSQAGAFFHGHNTIDDLETLVGVLEADPDADLDAGLRAMTGHLAPRLR